MEGLRSQRQELRVLGNQTAAPPQDAAALALRRAAPRSLVDPVLERVLEALRSYGTFETDATCGLEAGTVRRKEGRRIHAAALRVQHPGRVARRRGRCRIDDSW